MKLSKEQLRIGKASRQEYLQLPKTPIVLVLDNLASNINIGAMIRLADSFALEKGKRIANGTCC